MASHTMYVNRFNNIPPSLLTDTHHHTSTPRRSKQYTHQPQPANNFLDILFVVLEFLDRRADQLSLIQTQRDIYDLKAPTLLKGVVRISDVFRLDSFNSFMLGAPSARFPRLTRLAITIPSWSIRDKPDRKSTRLNSSHSGESRMPSSA